MEWLWSQVGPGYSSVAPLADFRVASATGILFRQHQPQQETLTIVKRAGRGRPRCMVRINFLFSSLWLTKFCRFSHVVISTASGAATGLDNFYSLIYVGLYCPGVSYHPISPASRPLPQVSPLPALHPFCDPAPSRHECLRASSAPSPSLHRHTWLAMLPRDTLHMWTKCCRATIWLHPDFYPTSFPLTPAYATLADSCSHQQLPTSCRPRLQMVYVYLAMPCPMLSYCSAAALPKPY